MGQISRVRIMSALSVAPRYRAGQKGRFMRPAPLAPLAHTPSRGCPYTRATLLRASLNCLGRISMSLFSFIAFPREVDTSCLRGQIVTAWAKSSQYYRY